MLPDYFFLSASFLHIDDDYDELRFFILFFFVLFNFCFVMQIVIQGCFFALLNTDNETKYYGLCLIDAFYQLYTLL